MGEEKISLSVHHLGCYDLLQYVTLCYNLAFKTIE